MGQIERPGSNLCQQSLHPILQDSSAHAAYIRQVSGREIHPRSVAPDGPRRRRTSSAKPHDDGPDGPGFAARPARPIAPATGRVDRQIVKRIIRFQLIEKPQSLLGERKFRFPVDGRAGSNIRSTRPESVARSISMRTANSATVGASNSVRNGRSIGASGESATPIASLAANVRQVEKVLVPSNTFQVEHSPP